MLFDDSTYCIDIPESRSSLIRRIEYDEKRELLFVKLKWNEFVYSEVKWSDFDNLCSSDSIGRYYLNNIKPNFKQVKNSVMTDVKKQPATKNQASDKKRFISMSINVREIVKEWIRSGEKGDYLNMKLVMLPDGELDRFGNLGFIVQEIPSELYKKAEAERKGSGREIKSPILGNAKELDWEGYGNSGSDADNSVLPTEPVEDLPF